MIFQPYFKDTRRGIEVDYFQTRKNGAVITLTLPELVYYPCDLKIINNFTLAKSSLIEFFLANNILYEFKNVSVTVYRDGHEEVFCDYANKFLQDFKDFETAERLERSDVTRTASCALDAKKEFLASICRSKIPFAQQNIFDQIFPQPQSLKEWVIWEDAKESVAAFLYSKSPGEYREIWSYDIKRSFPARIYRGEHPSGEGVYTLGDLTHRAKRWYIKRIMIAFVKKKAAFDFLNLEKKFADNGGKPFEYVVTEDIFDALIVLYDVQYVGIDGFYYRLQNSVFDKFFEKNFAATESKALSTYSKAKNNLLIGTFGTKDFYEVQTFSKIGGALKSDTVTVEKPRKAYYPIYLFANGAAKVALLKLIAPIWEKVIYANTDGFFVTARQDYSTYNSIKINKIGSVEERGKYEKIAIKEVSNYCGFLVTDAGKKLDMRLSGRRFNEKLMTYEAFVCGTFKSYSYLATKTNFLRLVELSEKSLEEFKKNDK